MVDDVRTEFFENLWIDECLFSFQVSLGPLMFASKFVLVGDHYQLPPLVQVSNLRIFSLITIYESLFIGA